MTDEGKLVGIAAVGVGLVVYGIFFGMVVTIVAGSFVTVVALGGVAARRRKWGREE